MTNKKKRVKNTAGAVVFSLKKAIETKARMKGWSFPVRKSLDELIADGHTATSYNCGWDETKEYNDWTDKTIDACIELGLGVTYISTSEDGRKYLKLSPPPLHNYKLFVSLVLYREIRKRIERIKNYQHTEHNGTN